MKQTLFYSKKHKKCSDMATMACKFLTETSEGDNSNITNILLIQIVYNTYLFPCFNA